MRLYVKTIADVRGKKFKTYSTKMIIKAHAADGSTPLVERWVNVKFRKNVNIDDIKTGEAYFNASDISVPKMYQVFKYDETKEGGRGDEVLATITDGGNYKNASYALEKGTKYVFPSIWIRGSAVKLEPYSPVVQDMFVVGEKKDEVPSEGKSLTDKDLISTPHDGLPF